MGVVWLAVPGAGTSGHQHLDAPAINENRRTVNASLLRRMLNTQNTGCVKSRKDSEGRRRDRSKHSWRGHTLGGDAKSKVKESRQVSMEENARADFRSHGKMCFITSPTVATGEVALTGFQRTDS